MNNLLSLGLGFLSWGFGIGALWKPEREGRRFSSLILCILSLFFQFREVNQRVNGEDWAAIEDTFPGVLFAATVLICVTLLLNAAAMLRKKKKHIVGEGQ